MVREGITVRHLRHKGGSIDEGLSLVEILLACVLLVVLSVPLLDVLRSLRLGYAHSADRTTAAFVAQAVLEEVRYRLYAFGSGSAEGGDEAMESFFARLGEEGARVASWRDGERSRYFARFENLQGTGLHGFTPEQHPEIYARLYDMLCDVHVRTPIPATDGGEPELGLAEIEVVVSWPSAGGGPRRPSLSLTTIVTCRVDDQVDEEDAVEEGDK